MDDLDDVMESRFDNTGQWSEPPRCPDNDLFAKEARQEITDCLDAAPEAQRLALVFREVEGLSTEEICNILEVSATNLGVMLSRVRNRLRNCLETKWERA